MSCLRMNLSITLASLLLGVLVASAQSQDRGDRGSRGDWGGRRDRGERGDRGFSGDFNGRPSGDFGGGGRFGGGGFGGGPPGGFGGPPSGFGGGGFGGGRSMMDTNGNGTIEQEELDRMPSFVRDMMKSRGVELKAGMSVDDMRSSMRAGFSRGRDDNGSSGGQDNGNNTNSSPVPAKPVLKPYVMKPKPALIATLPPAYSEVDTNFDGQLGLDEWMLSRRTDLNQFDEFDIDHDGFLIPDELKVAEVAATGTNAAMSVRTEKLTIVSATPKKSSTAAAGGDNEEAQSSSGSGRWSRGGDVSEQAKLYFTRLDRNQDGTIDKDEFQESRRVRGMFERAGIQPAAGMTLEEFTQALQKAASIEQSGGGN